MTSDEDSIVGFLRRSDLISPDDVPRFVPLSGGVSSDIWVVHSGDRSFCVKRALPRLRVTAEWYAPIERNATEVAWLTSVARFMPEAVPAVLAEDRQMGIFAMTFLSPDSHREWKDQLRHGVVDLAAAAAVGQRLATIHSFFARSEAAPEIFSTDAAFHSLRLEPYLHATASVHTDLAPVLLELAETTARTKKSVVHGDVSPKNIWLGPRGPLFLDAECAWFGDPAFDLAFCLNHLLLKTLWVPSVRQELLTAFDLLAKSYLTGVDWEQLAALEERASKLLPGLLLARIDGKSPVEYLDEPARDTARHLARRLLRDGSKRLSDVRRKWAEGLASVRRTSVSSARIQRVIGRRVWDSRGRPTVEAEVFVDDGTSGRAIAPAGASTGTHEAVDLRDGTAGFAGLGVDRAVAHVSGEIADALVGLPIDDQALIDAVLIELDGTANKGRLGANAIVAVSMASLHAAARFRREPLWRVLAEGSAPSLPMPMVQIFGGGLHASGRVDIQDFLVMPIGASTFDEALSMAARVYRTAGDMMAERGLLRGVADEGGWWPEFDSSTAGLDALLQAIERSGFAPGEQIGIAVDVAASHFRKGQRYHLKAEHAELDSDGLIELLLTWCRRYPIVSIEDPLAEDDDVGMRAFTEQAGSHLQIIGDDYLVTSADRIRAAAKSGACNAVLLKPNQVGTVTETSAALRAARDAGWSTIVSARSGETEDVTIVHLAVGWGAGQLKVGSFARSERMAKWNEGLRIEEALGSSAKLDRGLPVREPLWQKKS
jgi:phosphopyruvate hydratase